MKTGKALGKALGRAARWHYPPTVDNPGVFLSPLPHEMFVGYGGKLTPRVLRHVDSGMILYTVRLGHIEEDTALLDATLEEIGSRIIPVILEDGSTVTRWDLLGTGLIVELIAQTKIAATKGGDGEE